MTNTAGRSARLEARVSPDILAVLKRAAEIEGRSLSEFVVAAAREAATRTIEQTQIIRLSLKDQQTLAEALANPPEPSDAMRRAKAAHDRLMSPSR